MTLTPVYHTPGDSGWGAATPRGVRGALQGGGREREGQGSPFLLKGHFEQGSSVFQGAQFPSQGTCMASAMSHRPVARNSWMSKGPAPGWVMCPPKPPLPPQLIYTNSEKEDAPSPLTSACAREVGKGPHKQLTDLTTVEATWAGSSVLDAARTQNSPELQLPKAPSSRQSPQGRNRARRWEESRLYFWCIYSFFPILGLCSMTEGQGAMGRASCILRVDS